MHVCAEGQGRTVMVIDPEPEIVALLACMLRALGYRVMPAFCENDAIRLVQAGQIDAVIADEQMISGEDCASAFAIREAAPNIPIIIMSGGLGKTVCAANVLRKPFLFVELREKVAGAFRNRPEPSRSSRSDVVS